MAGEMHVVHSRASSAAALAEATRLLERVNETMGDEHDEPKLSALLAEVREWLSVAR
ncbi:MAG TPA: hypothetical protein VMI11_06335 [Actinomycetes bacterium]|nr:hypothetical protein [Actinomycetes bacterium]